MAIPLVATECIVTKKARCKDPRLSDCTNQFYDTRPLLPCGASSGSGGAGITRNRHALGDTPGTVSISFNAFNVPDQMDVYLDGVLVATTGRPVGIDVGDTMPWPLSFYYAATGQAYCTVKVTGPSGTAWSYTISCPA